MTEKADGMTRIYLHSIRGLEKDVARLEKTTQHYRKALKTISAICDPQLGPRDNRHADSCLKVADDTLKDG